METEGSSLGEALDVPAHTCNQTHVHADTEAHTRAVAERVDGGPPFSTHPGPHAAQIAPAPSCLWEGSSASAPAGEEQRMGE